MPLPTDQHGTPEPTPTGAPAPEPTPTGDTEALQAEVTKLRAQLDQAAPAVELMGAIKQNLAVARSASKEHAAIAEAVIRGNPLPPLGDLQSPEPTADLPDDLDDRDQRLIAAAQERTVRAMSQQMADEMAPLKQELELLRLRDSTRSLADTEYADRVAARKNDLTALLGEDPTAIRNLDGKFRQLDYPELYAEYQRLRQELAEAQGATATEAQRRASIAKLTGGGRGAAGTSPEVDVKARYKDIPVNQRMAAILDDVLSEKG